MARESFADGALSRGTGRLREARRIVRPFLRRTIPIELGTGITRAGRRLDEHALFSHNVCRYLGVSEGYAHNEGGQENSGSCGVVRTIRQHKTETSPRSDVPNQGLSRPASRNA